MELAEKTRQYQQNLEAPSYAIKELDEQLDLANQKIKDQNNKNAEQRILLENATRDKEQSESQAVSLERKLSKTKELIKLLEKKLRELLQSSEALKTKNSDLTRSLE